MIRIRSACQRGYIQGLPEIEQSDCSPSARLIATSCLTRPSIISIFRSPCLGPQWWSFAPYRGDAHTAHCTHRTLHRLIPYSHRPRALHCVEFIQSTPHHRNLPCPKRLNLDTWVFPLSTAYLETFWGDECSLLQVHEPLPTGDHLYLISHD